MPPINDCASHRRPQRWFSAGALILLLAVWGSATRAACGAFPILHDVVTEVESMHTQTDTAKMALSGHKVDMLRRDISRSQTGKALNAVGYGRKLDDIMTLKVNLGALSTLAIELGPERVMPFLKGSGFQRSFQHARDLVDRFCKQDNQAQQSGLATRILELIAGPNPTRQRPIGAAMWSMGLLITAFGTILGLHLIAKALRKRERRNIRRSKRSPCKIPVSLGALGGVSTCTVVDISLTGANVKNDLDLPVGTELHLNFGTMTLTGAVIWNNSQFTGAEFDTVLEQTEMAALLALSQTSRSQSGPNHLANAKRALARAKLETEF